jgi:subtilase family serine protease
MCNDRIGFDYSPDQPSPPWKPMASKFFRRSSVAAIAVTLLVSSYSFSQESQPNRIVRAVDSRSVVRLQGTIPPRVRTAVDRGPVSPTLKMQRMTLFFQPTAKQQAALDQLLVEQQDPMSANYHQWLTPEQFADRFGISSQDISTLAAWLTSQGFTVDQTARSRTWIAFSGTAAQVEAAFQTSIHNYVVDGKTHYAAAADPAIPAAFAGVVTGIGQLHNFAPHALNVKAKPRLTSSITGNHFVAPGDFATIYDLQSLYSNGINGTGQTIAIMGQTDLTTDSNPGRNGTPGVNGQQYDVVTFRNLAGLPALTSINFQIVVVPPFGDPGVVTADADEANLDVEWPGAIAPNANLTYVIENGNNGGNGAFGALQYAVDNIAANVFTISYGACEPQIDATTKAQMTATGQQANAQGQTIVAPSGDSGAADCDTTAPATQGPAVDFPGSLPTVTSMGGTTFSADSANTSNPAAATQYWSGSTNDTSASALAYIPETAWNDSSGSALLATGGGVSTFSPSKPVWQTGVGVPNDNARDVPDISFSSSPNHDGFLICSQSSCVNGYRNTDTTFDVIGGTSVATPSFAGVVALINQKLNAPQGNINPALYTQATNAPWAFHDITTGNNIVACQAGSTGCPSGLTIGYSAGVGYDLVTGLGSLDVGAFVNALTGVSDFSITPSTTSVTLPANGSSSLTLSLLGTGGSNISFTCSATSGLTATTCSAPSVTTTGGTVVSSTLTVSTTSANSQTGSVTVVATNGTATHVVPVAVTVNGTAPDFTVTSSSSSLLLSSGQSGTATITVTPSGGFTSDVALTCTVTTTLGSTTCSLSPATVTGGSGNSTLTVNGATLTGMLGGAPMPFMRRGMGTFSTFAFALGMVFTMKPKWNRRTKRAWRNAILGFLLLGVMVFLVSCGGGSSSSGGGTTPTPLSGTVTVTGTSGSLTHSVSLPVTIQ